jgi:hypothetical protein
MKHALLVLCVFVIQATGFALVRMSPADPSNPLVMSAAVIGAIGAAAFLVYRRRLIPVRARE